MIEIRSFEGTPVELAQFTNGVWRRWYEGKMLCPLWGANVFERELFRNGETGRDFLVAAYDGGRLVGSHPAKPIRIRLHGREMPATWGSFLTVDPDYRGQGIAQRMQEEFVRRHQKHGAAVNFGYLYGRSGKSMGPKFWLKQPKGNVAIIRLASMWLKALDHGAVARFEINRSEAWGTRILSLFQGPPKAPTRLAGIRPYRSADLSQCLQLVHGVASNADLAYLWDSDTLQNQLDYPGLSNTVVAEEGERICGLANYTIFPILGKTLLTLSVLDIVAFASDCPRKLRRRLIRTALHEMYREGAQAVTMLRNAHPPWRDMLSAGFFPMVPEYWYCGTQMQEDVRLKGVRGIQVLWR